MSPALGRYRGTALSASILLAAAGGTAVATTSPVSAATSNTITMSAPSFVQATIGQPLSVGVSGTDSDPSATLTYSATNIPTGMTIDPSTGIISGNPGGLVKNTVTVTATDGTGASGTASINWQTGAQITVGFNGPQSGTGGFPFEGQTVEAPLKVSDNATPYDTLTYQTADLPPGVHLDPATLLVTGWTTATGKYFSQITANGLDGGTGSLYDLGFAILGPKAGATGPVRLNLGGKCLDDYGDKSTAGNKIDIWTCNGSAAQKWTYESDGSLKMANGKCLDVPGQATAAGTRLALGDCTFGPGQWDNAPGGQLRDLKSGLCVTDPSGSTVNGTQVEITSCGGGASRAWTLPAETVHSAIGGRCLDDYYGSTANGARVDAYSCNGKGNQNWTFEPNGTVRVNGKCLDDYRGQTTVGSKIDLWTCNGSVAQIWEIAGTNDSLGVVLKHGTVCASPASMTAANGAQLVMEPCNKDQSYWHSW